MKKTHYLFFLLFLLPFLGKAQNWKAMGPDDANQPGAGSVQTASISNGTDNVFVASVYGNNKITIKKFEAGKWKTVSDAAFSENNTRYPKIVFNGTTPYVAYGDQSNNDKLTVKKYNGTNWELVGAAGFSGDYLQAIDLAFDGTTPYVAYTDGTNNRKVIVKQYNGTDWVAVGSNDVSDIYADKPTIALDGATPYMVYNDGNNNGKMTVKKYDGNNWVALADIGISNVDFPGLVVNSGTPYVIYGGWGNNDKLTVQKLDGTSWAPVGTDVFTSYITGAKINFEGTTPYVIYKTDDYMDPRVVVKKLNADASGWETVGDLGLLQGNSMGGMPGEQDPMGIGFINAIPFAFYLEGDHDKKVLVKQFDGTNWENLGTSGFSAGSAGLLSVASDGIFPYVAYRDGANGEKATVKKYNGAIWETVGSEGFSAGSVSSNMTLSFDAVFTPYLAYGDDASGGKLTVQRYTGSSWETVGSSSVSSGYADDNMLAFNGNIPYVVYKDGNQSRLSVKKFNSATSNWEIVGNPDFSETFPGYPSIAFNEGVPYVAYLEGGSIHRITVKKLNGNTWEVVGNTNFTQSQSYYSQIAFDNGRAYIIYADGGNGNKATVRIYNADTNKWELVGAVISSAGAGYPKLIFVDHTPYVAYADNSNSGKLTVKKFNGNDWETVGDLNVSAGPVGYVGITGIEGKLVAVYTASDKAYAKSFSLLSATPDASNILYVNKTVIGGDQSGKSWSNAFTELADALRWAKENETTWTVSNPLKIYVAKGKYLPKYSPADNYFGIDDGRRNSFLLVKNVQLYGGFDPVNGINNLSDARVIAKIGEVSNNGTVLSGDIANDDILTGSGSSLAIQNNQENNHHVVFSVGDVGTALLDGFTIANGNANINVTGIKINGISIGSYHYGAGIFIKESSSLSLKNITVYANAVSLTEGRGAGITNESASLILENVTIVKNQAFIAGGIYNANSASPTFTNGSISGNKSVSHAGGMYNVSGSSPVLTNIEIFGNSAGERGGAIYSKTSSNPVLTNLTVFGNMANDGGGLYNEASSSPIVRNSIFYANIKSGAMINNVTNHSSNGTPPKFSYSLIEGSRGSGNWNAAIGTDDGHNIDAHPMFTNVTNGDFTLPAGSPAINAGSNSYYATAQTPDLSGITFDLAGNLRFNGTVDMGAYEYQGTLPVNLISFTAKAETAGARLQWQTASEQSNKYFTISRSTDGVNFTTLGTINSKGESNNSTNYSFLDQSPANGTNYYLLQQTDIDGKSSDLGIRTVFFQLTGVELSVYPNPTADMANLNFAVDEFNNAEVIDLSGRILEQQFIKADQSETSFNLSNYKSGTYIIRLTGSKSTALRKVIKL